VSRHPAAEAAGRAIAEALDQPWATLSINDQSQLALAGQAAFEACAPFVKYEVLSRTAIAVSGNGTKDREFKSWLQGMAAAAGRKAYRR
jgi:hypothetical protein